MRTSFSFYLFAMLLYLYAAHGCSYPPHPTEHEWYSMPGFCRSHRFTCTSFCRTTGRINAMIGTAIWGAYCMHSYTRHHISSLKAMPTRVLANAVAGVAALDTAFAHSSFPEWADLFETARRTRSIEFATLREGGNEPLCIVDLHVQEDGAIANISTHNHRSYAYHHYYRYYSFTGRISAGMFINPDRGPITDRIGGGLTWQKLSALATVALQTDKDGLPDCQWMLWIDSDAIFTNFNIPLEPLLMKVARSGVHHKDVVLSREMTSYPDSFINSGVFLVRNSPLGRAFLEGSARLYNRHKDYHITDQNAIQEYVFYRSTRGLEMFERDLVEAHTRPEVALVPQRALNSFIWVGSMHEAYSSRDSEWKPCDFIAHLAGRSNQERVDGMQAALAQTKGCIAPAERLHTGQRLFSDTG